MRHFDVARGAWTTPSGVEAQVQRMFEDEDVIGSWRVSFTVASVASCGHVEPDPGSIPVTGRGWKSMIHETKAYFAEVFRSNHPITELVDSDWTLLNPLWRDRAQPCGPSDRLSLSRRYPPMHLEEAC